MLLYRSLALSPMVRWRRIIDIVWDPFSTSFLSDADTATAQLLSRLSSGRFYLAGPSSTRPVSLTQPDQNATCGVLLGSAAKNGTPTVVELDLLEMAANGPNTASGLQIEYSGSGT